jgi:hypothetical protein
VKINPEVIVNRAEAAGTDTFRDSMRDHRARWDYMRDDRAEWTREAWRDKCVIAGQTFNSTEEQWYADQDRDIPNYNLALMMKNTIAGTEAQTRADIKYQPVGPSDVDGAKAATTLARKVARANNMGRQFSTAFDDALDTGIGWIETGYSRYVTGDPVYIGTESSFNVWTDPAMRKADMSDATDMCRMKLLRPRQLARMVPASMRSEIQYLRGVEFNGHGPASWSHSADFSNTYGDRPNVNDAEWDDPHGPAMGERLLEAVERWYKVDRWVEIVRHKDGRWWEVKPENAYRMAEMVVDDEAHEDGGMVQEMRYAMFCEDMEIGDWASRYRHRSFPLTPLWCYRDQYGRPMGVARAIRTAAKDFNSRMSNLLQRAMMRQVWIERGAVADLDKALEEIRLPDGVVQLEPGAIQKQRVLFRDELEASAVEASLLQMDLRFITDLAGVTEEMAGRHGNADSGVGIQAKIQQSQTALYTLFDNRTWALGEVGKQLLSCIQAKYTREQAVRVTEKSQGLDWIWINKPTTDPVTGQPAIANDITQAEYDVEVTDVPLTASLRMAQFEALTNFLAPFPVEVKLLFGAKLADLADLPDQQEISQKLEQFAQQLMPQQEMPTIDPALITQLVDAGQLTREGAATLLTQLAAAVAAAPPGAPGAQPTTPPTQGPGAQPGPSASTPAPPAVA